MTRHGATIPVPPEACLADDPELWLVNADLVVWGLAHPCECDGVCECEDVPE